MSFSTLGQDTNSGPLKTGLPTPQKILTGSGWETMQDRTEKVTAESTDLMLVHDADGLKAVQVGNAASGLGSGATSGNVTIQSLSAPPQAIADDAETQIVHTDISNSKMVPMVMMQSTGGQDQTILDIDFDTADESNYVQEDATNGTDFVNDKIQLTTSTTDSTVKLLLHGNGDSGDTIVDMAGNALTVGTSCTVNTTTKKWGSGSIRCDNTTNTKVQVDLTSYLTSGLAGHSWCLEMWLYADAAGGNIAASHADGTYNSDPNAFSLWRSGTDLKINASSNGSTWDIASSVTIGTLAQDTWKHLALCYDAVNNNLEVFYDGTRTNQFTSVTTFPSHKFLSLFNWRNLGQWSGYVDDVRFSVDSASNLPRYSGATYTVPAAEFSDITFPTSQAYYVYTDSALGILTTAIQDFDSLAVTTAEPTGTTIKALVSWDGGTTWQYENAGWQNSSLANLQTEGMTITELQTAFTDLEPPEGATELRFAFDLKTTDATVTPSIDGLNIVYDENAFYEPAILGGYSSANAEFGVKHWSGVTKFKNLTGGSKTVFAYVYSF